VADTLKSGYPVSPELFLNATIYFSNIVTFASLVSNCSPLEVVELLNNLWTLFDEIIAKHDVYKVNARIAIVNSTI
jgi:class 3 adenylate cyclase